VAIFLYAFLDFHGIYDIFIDTHVGGQKMANNAKPYLSIAELSDYLQIAKGTIYKYTSKKRIPYFKIGKRVRFSKNSIDRWVKKLEKQSPKRRKRK
jgi:excisionase family DNA binding protein